MSARARQAVRLREDLLSILRRWAAQEAGRFILAVPLLMIAGIAFYFSLAHEPEIGPTLMGLAMSGAIWARSARSRWAIGEFAGKVLFFFALGFALVQVRTALVEAPRIERETAVMPIIGELIAVEARPDSQRLTIVPEQMGGMRPVNMPARIRVNWRGEPTPAQPGDLIRIRAALSPPPGPAIPGGFDYGRQLYFERIGAVGYAVSQAEVVATRKKQAWRATLDRWRGKIADRIMEKAGGVEGTVVAALVTGKRERIPPEVTDQLRDTGLAHLLAISGLHMGLVCGFLFFALRYLLVLHEGWATRFPVKKWAAGAAMVGGLIYLGLSGAAWSAQRAFIMAAIAFAAILVDRQAISLRNVAIAAIVILVLQPEAVMSAGFQMSFSAVTALIATYAIWDKRRRDREKSPFMMPVRFLGGIFITSLVAGAATAPYAIYHFHRIAAFGLPANILVMPLVTIGVMPVAVMGLAMMPLGLDGPFWWVAARSIGLVLDITGWIAHWPEAVVTVAQLPTLSWLLLIMGMLTIALLTAPWRWAGVAAFPLAWALVPFVSQPVVYIAAEAANVGVVLPSEGEPGVSLASHRRKKFTVERWLEAYGLEPVIRDQPKFGECGEEVCAVSLPHDGRLAWAGTMESAALACRQNQIVVAPLWDEGELRKSCPALLFTALSVSRTGTVAIHDRNGQLSVVTGLVASRPWSGR